MSESYFRGRSTDKVKVDSEKISFYLHIFCWFPFTYIMVARKYFREKFANRLIITQNSKKKKRGMLPGHALV